MKTIRLIALLAIFFTMSGCALNTELIQRGAVSSRNDIFTEVVAGTEAPERYAILHLSTSVKTPLAWEPESGLSQIINIDGQALQMTDSGKKECRDASGLRDPETGCGFKHVFSLNLLLKAGTHSLIVAFPDKGVAITKEITLPAGTSNFLQVEPQYRSLPKQGKNSLPGTSFKEGILLLDTKFNDNPL